MIRSESRSSEQIYSLYILHVAASTSEAKNNIVNPRIVFFIVPSGFGCLIATKPATKRNIDTGRLCVKLIGAMAVIGKTNIQSKLGIYTL